MTQQQSGNYIIAYGYNDKFYLTEQEAQAIMRATEEGKRIVKFNSRVFTTNYSWIMPVEEVEKETNPILNDPNYQEYQQIKQLKNIDEPTLKRKIALERVLDQRYPRAKYEKEWFEAQSNTTQTAITL